MANQMDLNIDKCYVMRFSRGKNPATYPYAISDNILSTVSSARDLGVIVDSALSFDEHTRVISARANKILGFIRRSCSGFKNPKTFLHLYNALVLPHLEYASVIWSPKTAKNRDVLERVQHRFLRYLAYKMGEPLHRFDHDYGPIMRKVGIRTLECRRIVTDLSFLFKIINGLVCNQHVIGLIDFYVPSRPTRHAELFRPPLYTSRFGHADPFYRISNLANQFSTEIDMFHGSLPAFKASVYRATSKNVI